MIKYTWESHEDREGLCNALGIIGCLAVEIDRQSPSTVTKLSANQASLSPERTANRKISLSSMFHYHPFEIGRFDDLADPSREWIKSGAMKVACGKKEQMLVLCLFSDMLIVVPNAGSALWGAPGLSKSTRRLRGNNFLRYKNHDIVGKILLSELWIKDLPDSVGGLLFPNLGDSDALLTSILLLLL